MEKEYKMLVKLSICEARRGAKGGDVTREGRRVTDSVTGGGFSWQIPLLSTSG